MFSGKMFDTPMAYCIKVQGQLDPKWSDWFDGFDITVIGEETTILVGRVADQAALHGLLNKIRDLGLPLIRVDCLDCTPGNADG